MSYKSKAQPAELDPVQLEYFSEWYHPIIREMVGLDTFSGDPEWIKGRLAFPLRLEQIKRSLEILEKLQVIHFDKKRGRYVRSDERITTEDEVDSMAIVRYHQKMMEVGRESITRVREEKRDIRSITVSIPTEAVPVIKGKIQEWLAEIMDLDETVEKADDVYQLNIQLFPFTKTN